MSISTVFVLLTSLAGVLAPASARAQTTPGQVGDTLKPAPTVVAPKSAPAVEAPKPAPQVPQAGASSVMAQVSAFFFKGNTVYSSQQLSTLLSAYTGRALTLMEVYAAADVVADFYTSNGYTLASVSVPPQKVTDGNIVLEISEGRIGKVTTEQSGRRRPERLQRYLGVKDGDIYRVGPVERGMMKLNELPGLTARALVKPGAEFGTSDLVIRAQEAPVSGTAFVDNNGRESIGETRVGASVNFNNPSGLDDQIQLLGLVSSGASLKYISAGYNFPIGFSGTRLSLNYGYADFEVRDVAGLTGDSRNARITLSYPAWRSNHEILNLSAGVADTRTSTDLSGLGLPGTSITVLELGALYNHIYANAAMTQVSTTLSTNFETQERADLTSGNDVDGKEAARIELDLLHVQPLPARFSLVLRGNTVWSPDPLADPVSYSIGGPQSIRGFPPSEVRGDRGYFGQLTLQQRYQLGAVRLVPRIFVDSGEVFVVDRLPGQKESESLTSAGIGADLSWKNFSLRVDVSDPQGSRIASDGDDSTRVFGTLSASF